jgi:hypothetical protein
MTPSTHFGLGCCLPFILAGGVTWIGFTLMLAPLLFALLVSCSSFFLFILFPKISAKCSECGGVSEFQKAERGETPDYLCCHTQRRRFSKIPANFVGSGREKRGIGASGTFLLWSQLPTSCKSNF